MARQTPLLSLLSFFFLPHTYYSCLFFSCPSCLPSFSYWFSFLFFLSFYLVSFFFSVSCFISIFYFPTPPSSTSSLIFSFLTFFLYMAFYFDRPHFSIGHSFLYHSFFLISYFFFPSFSLLSSFLASILSQSVYYVPLILFLYFLLSLPTYLNAKVELKTLTGTHLT